MGLASSCASFAMCPVVAPEVHWCLARLCRARFEATVWTLPGAKEVLDTVALLNIEPLGTIICGENTQDRSMISRYFSHQILTRVVQYLARLRYAVYLLRRLCCQCASHQIPHSADTMAFCLRKRETGQSYAKDHHMIAYHRMSRGHENGYQTHAFTPPCHPARGTCCLALVETLL
jgi:hypothetical protein